MCIISLRAALHDEDNVGEEDVTVFLAHPVGVVSHSSSIVVYGKPYAAAHLEVLM